MARRTDSRTLLFEKIRTSPPKFVHVTGVPYAIEMEQAEDLARLDHVWLTLEVPPFGRVRAVINTLSRLNRDAGFDARVRVAIVAGSWSEKPETGLLEEQGQDYALIESAVPVSYRFYEHEALAELLISRAKKAVRAEVWGDLYAKDHLGVHQIHCRRASCAVSTDLKNRDGALKLYYGDNTAELFLFKFCGQI
ncbi:MAG TPA: hypothetical protein VFD27_10615 [Chthoniobacteraceae bacterium]|jgi:hypothetical protein|nr:hypothetical protein [Chthoniobacteraceae bacterium]